MIRRTGPAHDVDQEGAVRRGAASRSGAARIATSSFDDGATTFLRRLLRILVFTKSRAKQIRRGGGIGHTPDRRVGDFGPGQREFTDGSIVRPTDFGKPRNRLRCVEIKTAMQTTIDTSLIEDAELASGLARHSSAAMSELCGRYGTILKAVIMKVIHDESEAEDVLQEVFLQVWDRADSYSPEKGKLLSWLSTVARRRAIDRVRQACAYRRATDRFEIVSRHPDKELSETHPVEHEAQQDDVRELIDRQLDLLPDRQREAISLAYLEGRSQREIATITHTPLGTVKTRIELGLKKLSHAIGASRDKIL